MQLVGLESVKEQFLTIYAEAEVCKVQGLTSRGRRFHAVIQGNPGTSKSLTDSQVITVPGEIGIDTRKTTTTQIYARPMNEIGKLKTNQVVETPGSELAHMGLEETYKPSLS